MHPDDKVSPCSQKGCAVLGLTGHCFQDNHSPKKKEPHIKKPLNAFMLYMKVITAYIVCEDDCDNPMLQEMRPVVQAECTLKESAAINQILGRRVSCVCCLSCHGGSSPGNTGKILRFYIYLNILIPTWVSYIIYKMVIQYL